jgi:hypothetical protein
MEYLKQDRFPSWLQVTQQTIVNWQAIGPVPGELRQRFPNY